MTELEQIQAAWQEAEQAGESAVLATVVRVQGSTYRRAGARLLLTTGGRRVGSVSGGCLEADLAKKAWWLTEGGKAAVRHYDTSVEGEIAQEFGLGCNGIIHVLLERLEHTSLLPFVALEAIKRERRPATMATIVSISPGSPVSIGQRWIRFPDGTIHTNFSSLPAADFLTETAPESPGPATFTWNDESHFADFFIEPLLPRFRLLIFGAGDDAIPMTRLARFMGYETVVLDGRSHLARAERFPSADRVAITTPDDPLSAIATDQWTAALLMSHSYAQDLAALRALSDRNLPYLGVLGPRARTEKMLGELGIDPESFSSGKLAEELHSPLGLDIGADGAEQIALAAIAEIQSVINRRAGGRLRAKAGPLHPQTASGAGQRQQSFSSVACPLNQ
jgi:xanthine/CO dehydrogenase XdhC/CoxF family maturation factor